LNGLILSTKTAAKNVLIINQAPGGVTGKNEKKKDQRE